jgi:hypothetical protein
MHRVVLQASAAVVLLVGAISQPASGQTPPVRRYATVISIQVPAEKEAAFVDFYKTGAGAKTVRARLKANPKALGWSLRHVVYPGDPAPRANYVIVAVANETPSEPDAGKRDEMYRAAAGMTYADYMQNVRSMSSAVGTTLWHVHDLTPDYGLAEGDYISTSRLKTAEGKGQELTELMRDVRLAMATERVKAGSQKGWAFSHLAFPTGTSLPFDAATNTVYKDLASAVGGGGGGGGAAALFAKLFPNKNYARYLDDSRELAKVVRTDLYRVAVAYRQ